MHIARVYPLYRARGKTRSGKKPAQVLTNLQQLCHDRLLRHVQDVDLLACHGFEKLILGLADLQ